MGGRGEETFLLAFHRGQGEWLARNSFSMEICIFESFVCYAFLNRLCVLICPPLYELYG